MDIQRENQERDLVNQAKDRMIETLDRALKDSQFREQLLSDRLGKGDGDGTRAELSPAAREQRRELLQQVLDRAQKDNQFRQELLQRPRKALLDGGFAPQVERLRAELPGAEVQLYGTATWGTVFGGTTTTFLYTGTGTGTTGG